jgi:DNA-binding NarL/FixJ family response regulator
MMSMDIKILLADDHAFTRVGVKNTLESEPGYRVVAEAENGREAVHLVLEHHPDVVVLDISMPELNGLDATQQILEHHPETKVIILSMHSDKRFVENALTAGASGYLLKDCAIDEIVLAMKHILKGNCYLSPAITGVVVEQYRKPQQMDDRNNSSNPLTTREREVLQLIAEGKTTKEIAEELHISTKTVEARRKQIMDKLDIHSIAQLTKYAIREGITSIES